MAAAPSGGGGGWMKWVGIGCGALLVLTCVLAIVSRFLCAAAIQGATAGLPAVPAGGGGGTCGRAVECCQAYMATMPGAAGTVDCNLYGQAGMPDAGCQSAIDGFRTGLQAMQLTVPASCQ